MNSNRVKKSIIISIQPQWVEKILNGAKTIEIRKSIPKCDFPIDVYIYCCKSNNGSLNYFGKEEGYHYMPYEIGFWCKKYGEENDNLCGKIVSKFTLNKAEYLAVENLGYRKIFYTEEYDDLEGATQLSNTEMEVYFCNKPLKNGEVVGYAWHIDNLEIFDEPMELNQFYKGNYEQIIDNLQTVGCDSIYCPHLTDDGCDIMYCPSLKIKKAPQSWCYAYKEV